MCNNYRPTQKQLLRDVYGVVPPSLDWKPETWPDYLVRLVKNGSAERMGMARSIAEHVKLYIGANLVCLNSTILVAEDRLSLGRKKALLLLAPNTGTDIIN